MTYLILLLLLCLSWPGETVSSNMKGVWMPIQAVSGYPEWNDFASAEASAASQALMLARCGVTDIFVDAWNNGVAYFNSPSTSAFLGPTSVGPDILGAVILAAASSSYKFNVHAWLEYGCIGCNDSIGNKLCDVAHEKRWILGSYQGFTWLDCRMEGVQSFIANLSKDALSQYPSLSSVQLDDHFAIPMALLPPSSNASLVVEEFTDSATKVSLLVQNPSRFSLAPATLDFALSRYAVDWLNWAELNLFSTFYPQIYRYSARSFIDEMDYTTQKFSNSTIPPSSNISWIPGVRGSGHPPTDFLELSGMLDTCDNRNSGFVLWYSNIILGTVSVETSYALSQRFGGSCSFNSDVHSPEKVSSTAVILCCSAVFLASVVGFLFMWTRFGASSASVSPEIRQDQFILRNLVIIFIAEILMTIPQAGIPLLFTTRIQRILCTDRQLPCSSASVFPSDSVIGDTNLYTSYLSSALGGSNFFGTLLIGSVSDILGRRFCILIVAFGLVADCLICMLCNDLKLLFALRILVNLPGGFWAFLALLYSCAADLSSPSSRSRLFGLVEGVPCSACSGEHLNAVNLIFTGGLFLGLSVGPFLIDNVLLQATTSQITFGIGSFMAALSAVALFLLQETKSFVFLRGMSDEPLLISSASHSTPHKLSLSLILSRAGAGVRCIFTSKSAKAPGIVFCASLLTMQVSTSCLFAYLESVFRFDVSESGLWYSALFAFNSAYAYLGTRLLVPRIGETNVTIIGFLGSSAGLAIFAIGAVSGNQVLASTCAGLVSMTGMVFPSVRAIISRSADRNLQGAVQAALGLMSAFTAALGPVAFGSLFKATSTWFPGTVFAVGSFFMICSALTMYFTRLSRLSI